MKNVLICVIISVALLLAALPGWADILEMKNGQLIEGTYLGGTQQTVRFQVKNDVVVYPVSEILALTFSQTSGSSGAAFPKPPPPRSQPKAITLLPGTKLLVRMANPIDVTIAQPDDWFNATLDSDLLVDGNVVLPKGMAVNGQVVRAEQTRNESVIELTLQELVLKDQVIPIATTSYVAKEKSQTFLDPKSLKVVTRPRSPRIDSQSLLEFKTTEPVKIGLVSTSQTSGSSGTAFPKPTPTSQVKMEAITLLPGTKLPVRMTDSIIDVTTAQPDDWFYAILDSDLVVDGKVALPKGMTVLGQVVRAEQTRNESVIELTLQELVLKDQVIPIVTTSYVAKEKSQTVIDANSLKIVARPRSLRIDSQKLLEFKTTEPVKIELAK